MTRIRVDMVEKSLSSLVKELTKRDIRRQFDKDPNTRIVFQKVLYLLQSSGLLISPTHQFEFHFSGPHSPDWAFVAHAVAGSGRDLILQLDDDYATIKRVIGDGSMAWLVALATCHWYHCVAGLGKNAAKKVATKERRHRALLHFDDAWEALEKAEWLQSRLPFHAALNEPTH